MTVSRGRPVVRGGVEWDECSLLPDRFGVSWWMAVSLALGLTAVGVFADLQRLDRLGFLFQACYLLGCLLAVSMVQRKGLFGPMVQPPLILATVVPGVVLATGALPADAGTAGAALAISTPLINAFPTMAITTGLTLAVGIFRLLTQRPSSSPPPADVKPAGPTSTRAKPADATSTGAKPRPTTPTGKPVAAPDDDGAITRPIPRQPPHRP